MHANLTPSPSSPEGALGAYLRAIRSHRLLVTLVALAAVAGSLVWLSVRSAQYQSTAQLLVTPLPQDDSTFLGIQLLRDSGDPTRTIQTAATLVESPEAGARAAAAIGSGWDASRVLDAVEVTPEGESNILAVTATAESGRLAARVANEFTKAALEVRQQALQRQVNAAIARVRAQLAALQDSGGETAADLAARLNELQSVRGGRDPTLALSQPATAPSSPIGAGPALVVALSLIGGLALGAGTAVLLELVNRRLRDEDEAVALYPLPILARVPIVNRRLRQTADAAPWYLPPSVREAFRTVLVQLDEQADSAPRAIMVTSASTGDGKTTSAINLAAAIAASGRKAILMDCDVRKPDVTRKLGIEARHPLRSVASPKKLANRSFSDLLVPAPHLQDLSVLPVGAAADGDMAHVETLTNRLADLLGEARRAADYVVLDTAPLGEVSDALRIAHEVDDILIVTRPGNTNRASFEVMRDLLQRTGHRPTGMVVIGEQLGGPRGDYGYGLASREMTTGESILARFSSR